MPKNVTLPDGRTLMIPDDASPEMLSQMKQQLTAKFGPSPQRTIADVPSQFTVPGGKTPLNEGLHEATALANVAMFIQGMSESQGSTMGATSAPMGGIVSKIAQELSRYKIQLPEGFKLPFGIKVTRGTPSEVAATTASASAPATSTPAASGAGPATPKLIMTPQEFASHLQLRQTMEALTQEVQPQARLAGMIAAGTKSPIGGPGGATIGEQLLAKGAQVPTAQPALPGNPFNPGAGVR